MICDSFRLDIQYACSAQGSPWRYQESQNGPTDPEHIQNKQPTNTPQATPHNYRIHIRTRKLTHAVVCRTEVSNTTTHVIRISTSTSPGALPVHAQCYLQKRNRTECTMYVRRPSNVHMISFFVYPCTNLVLSWHESP